MPCPKTTKVGWLDKVSFIKTFAFSNCLTNWRVYAETGSKATFNLVMYLSGISMTEGIYTLLRPKMGRSMRHGKNKGERGTAIGEEKGIRRLTVPGQEAIPDSANLVMSVIDDIIGPFYPSYGPAGEAIFKGAEPLIRAGYYITMVNAPIDFAYDWYSGILLNPNSKCDQGHGEWANFFLDPPNMAYHPVAPGLPLIPPVGCEQVEDYIFIPEGMWIFEHTIGIVKEGPSDAEGSMFVKVMLGRDSPVQCGNPIGLDISSSGRDEQKTRPMKIQGPEIVRLYASFHADPQPISGVRFYWQTALFRM